MAHGVQVLFWGFANAVCTVKEAKQFYTFFGLGANVALVFSGQTIRHFSAIREKVWQTSLSLMSCMRTPAELASQNCTESHSLGACACALSQCMAWVCSETPSIDAQMGT
jgi:ATP/ADP translocase